MKTKLWIAIVSVALFATLHTGCSLFEESGEVIAEVRAPSTLLLHNTTGRTVSYFVGDEDAMALIGFHFNVSDWPTIGAGQIAEVPFEEIVAYTEETRRLWIKWFHRGDVEGNTVRLTIGE